jgi:hypothetical protein
MELRDHPKRDYWARLRTDAFAGKRSCANWWQWRPRQVWFDDFNFTTEPSLQPTDYHLDIIRDEHGVEAFPVGIPLHPKARQLARSAQAILRQPRPPLRLVALDRVGEDAIRLTYVPA